ncbi:hypothetical protein Bca101_049505 [Brassica carinata]
MNKQSEIYTNIRSDKQVTSWKEEKITRSDKQVTSWKEEKKTRKMDLIEHRTTINLIEEDQAITHYIAPKTSREPRALPAWNNPWKTR